MSHFQIGISSAHEGLAQVLEAVGGMFRPMLVLGRQKRLYEWVWCEWFERSTVIIVCGVMFREEFGITVGRAGIGE
jgi:hypothetical protein